LNIAIAAMTEPWTQQVLVERVNLRTTTSIWLSPWFELLAVLAMAAVDRRLLRADEPAALR
jgi:apolipoprotein N-acyltransferase